MSKTKAIERAIDHFVKTDAYERVRELRGAFPDIADHDDELMRADDEREAWLEQLRGRKR